MDNSIEEKLKNLEDWNKERERIKPLIDIAIDYHTKARTEAHWKNYETSVQLYKEAIVNYKNAVSQNPKYYLKDLLERIDHVIGEYINNTFNLKTSGDKLQNEDGIRGYMEFVNSLKQEEMKYIDSYDMAQAYLRIADFYYEKRNFGKALEFYTSVIDARCTRPFINREAYLKMAGILFDQARFKEALVNFVAVLSFDKDNSEVISHLERCLEKLGISEHRGKFLKTTPNEAKKLIMEIL